MGGDDYVITSNSKHTDAHKAAHDLDAQVTELKRVCKLSAEALALVIDVIERLDECEMARLRGNGDKALVTAKKAEAALRAMTPNDRVDGRDAALSRRVPSHDGLGTAVPPAPTFKNGETE